MNKYIKYIIESFFDDIEDDLNNDYTNDLEKVYYIKIIEDWCESLKIYPDDIKVEGNVFILDFSTSQFLENVIDRIIITKEIRDVFSDWDYNLNDNTFILEINSDNDF